MTMGGARANSTELAAIGPSQLVRLLGDWSAADGDALHTQLADQVRHLVVTGAIASGTRLPSERSLGVALDVSRNTVAKAFDELRSVGVLASRQGDGTYVSAGRRRVAPRGDDRLLTFISEPEDGRAPTTRIDLRSAALPGLPLVADAINRLGGARTRELVASHGYLPSGLPELRDAIAGSYDALGLPTHPEQILVTSGAQQALRLVASSLIQPGATVVVEEPSFRGALDSLTSLGARLVGVPSGPSGIDVDALAATIAEVHPVLLVVQSTVHNPTGSVMDGFARRRVAGLASEHGIPVIDDATLADTIIDGDRFPVPLAAYGDTVTMVGSVSKSFWGGLRVGWVRADRNAIEQLAAMKGGEDLGTSVVAQLLASQLLPDIAVARDLRHAVLRDTRRVVLAALADALPDWQPQVPTGGASLWTRLPTSTATAFTQRAERLGVQVLPGPVFSCGDALDDHVRISYAGPIADTQRGIRRLADAWAEFYDD